MCNKCYPEVNPKQSFPKMEEKIQKFWKENDTFQKSVDSRPENNTFNFYDGPPFATGTPHYGHLLAGTLKDVIPRYQTMLGKRVDRRFGWDCHGLPIENIVEKELNISGKSDIEDNVGVHTFNETCRSNVLTYTDEWQKVVERMGRWVDMDNPYKTMDKEFMESVWWVFKSIYDKGLIYEGNRVVPYCPRCSTPLSNFEVNQGYKDKQDKTVTVKFKVKGNDSKYILAWTTTPWTLPANLGLAVGEDIIYAEVLDKESGETYVLAKDRLESYYKNEEDYSVVREYEGKCLVGIEYEPIVDDFKIQLEEMQKDMGVNFKLGKNSYKVILGHHVTTESGTGVVHIAPAFGEDDNIIGKEHDLGIINHIDDEGQTVGLLNDEDNGIKVFDFNEKILRQLKDKNAVVVISSINHSYPHCWRCKTPLIYRAISAWYVAVEEIKDKMIANNDKINWVPGVIKKGRFGKWLEGARDWNISRNRYWGSAIPVWQSEDKKEEIVIGSIEELYELNKEFGQIQKEGDKYIFTKTGKEIDIHKHFVDEILLKNPKTGTTLKRIPEVLDCWFESGSMPYASKHYPFEDVNNFKFPAEFIAEGLDQTRGWFYTLLILGTALFDNTPFLNVIVNGIVLAEDGRKMSKSEKNYPDPSLIFDKYGADAMRFYLMNSPVVEAQDFRFAENGVEEVVKKVILPLWNTYYFFTTYANIDEFKAENGNFYYVRHGETDNNKNGILNGGDDDQPLNETGIEQTKKLAEEIKNSGVKFDAVVYSPMTRTVQTKDIITEALGYEVEQVEVEGLREQLFGEFCGMSHEDIKSKHNLKDDLELRKLYRNNSKENLEQFVERISKTYSELVEKYRDKNVLIVAHGGTFRAMNTVISGIDNETSFFSMPVVKNSKMYKLPNYSKANPLDKWIISELNKLVSDVATGLDNYKLNDACKPIVKFMDNLTNWYIRRSRKRFWGSEMTTDKLSAYNTLYEVLVEVTKVIAPFMPFVSEEIFKNLTNKESVHLELFPTAVDSFIMDDLSTDMQETQDIITLGLAARANSKIRVRQPLSYIKITHNLSEYYKDILKEELNVKDVVVFNAEELPQKICKPNARLIGPKFGKDVKFIMSNAKTGNFEELDNGNVKVGDFKLLAGEFEIEFVSNSDAKNSSEVIESGKGKVVALNTELTDELKSEGIARDIIRQIQESRKEAGYNVDDRIEVCISGEANDVINTFKDYIGGETLSTVVESLASFDLEKEVNIEGLEIKIQLKK